MPEEIYFQSGDIEITQSLAKFGPTSYPIANVGSLSVKSETTGNEGVGCGILMYILAGFILFAAIGSGTGKYYFWALIAMLLGFVISQFKGKTELLLVLRTSSGDEEAFRSTDSYLVESVKAAIERAVRR